MVQRAYMNNFHHTVQLVRQKVLSKWMVYGLVVRARVNEYGGCEFESRSLHWKPETKHHEDRGSCYGQK